MCVRETLSHTYVCVRKRERLYECVHKCVSVYVCVCVSFCVYFCVCVCECEILLRIRVSVFNLKKKFSRTVRSI